MNRKSANRSNYYKKPYMAQGSWLLARRGPAQPHGRRVRTQAGRDPRPPGQDPAPPSTMSHLMYEPPTIINLWINRLTIINWLFSLPALIVRGFLRLVLFKRCVFVKHANPLHVLWKLRSPFLQLKTRSNNNEHRKTTVPNLWLWLPKSLSWIFMMILSASKGHRAARFSMYSTMK